jgi:hypothetical protein
MRLSSPAAARNISPIGEVLAEWLPATGLVLEIASGSGEHALAFSRRFPQLRWQPSDPDPQARASIAGWREAEGPANLLEPLAIDVCDAQWPIARADAVVAINMVHISPWEASIGLIAGAARVLGEDGALILYGPWIVEGIETAPSNLAFDADLRRRDPAWGLRRVNDFAAEADMRGFRLAGERRMPANNTMLLFARTGVSA